jgi:aromatic ring-opening dioxygenase LigB subunit
VLSTLAPSAPVAGPATDAVRVEWVADLARAEKRTGVVFAALMAHAPVFVPDVGRERVSEIRRTVEAMHAVAREVVAVQPELLVLISPHLPRHPTAFGIWADPRVTGSLAQFGAPAAVADLPNDLAFAGLIESEARARGLGTWAIRGATLDHGAMVPLWFLVHAGWCGPTVLLGLNMPFVGGMQTLGEAIRAVAERSGKRVAVIASGDMSHRLLPEAPAGFDPRAKDFDRAFIETVERGEYAALPHFDRELQELAAEDVVDSTLIAAHAAGGEATGHRVLSYEGPFGVGYGVAVLSDPQPRERPRAEAIRLLPQVARRSIETALTGGSAALPERKGRDLRGCVGTIGAQGANIVEETWRSARSAALADRRFPPVTADELDQLSIEISLIHPPEPVASKADLDPARFGVIVTTPDGRRGLLLPGIEEIVSVEQQLQIACQKGGIQPSEQVTASRFTVEKIREERNPR